MGIRDWFRKQYQNIDELLDEAEREHWLQLDLRSWKLTKLPERIARLSHLQVLNLSETHLTELPEWLGQLSNLQSLDLSTNPLRELPKSLGQMPNLQSLDLTGTRLRELPESLGQLPNLQALYLNSANLHELPDWLGNLSNLKVLALRARSMSFLIQFSTRQKIYTFNKLPDWVGRLSKLEALDLSENRLSELPEWIGQLSNLQTLNLSKNKLLRLPEGLAQLSHLRTLDLSDNLLQELPEWLGKLSNLNTLDLSGNRLPELPESFAQLSQLSVLHLNDNPLNPAFSSAYRGGLSTLRSYLLSVADQRERERLYETKLVLVGEGGVGKTSLLKALSGIAPRKGEPTTHGVQIERSPMYLPHPDEPNILIQFNAWDFGGQEVYRVTHQFFFSPRALYLLVWEPRKGAQQSQVEEWLNMLRLRVGAEARVLIVSTHCSTGERIARIDKPVLLRDYSPMILGFLEIDSFVDDPETGDKIGLAALKAAIADAAKNLPQMGMAFNRGWREARDSLRKRREPLLPYTEFANVCAQHGLDADASKTLAILMHDLGYIVYYGDDAQLSSDVVLQPEWLTKAIGFVLENRKIQEMEGILPDSRLREVWEHHSFANEPRYPPALYPFFLRLMEKYDVSYRLEDGTGSLVAQHVPLVRPPLPWLPDEELAPNKRRLAVICQLAEVPPGLVPWMIVRTHDYAHQVKDADARLRRLHWQKGMFLRYKSHGEALLELRDREFHIYTEAVWPQYFMDILRQTLQTLIDTTWPGLAGRYTFSVPCQTVSGETPCSGRFDIQALRQFLEEGDTTIRCMSCRRHQEIVELLYGLEEDDTRDQLAQLLSEMEEMRRTLREGLAELESRVASSVMTILHGLANEAKEGPRLFTMQPSDGNWLRPFTAHYHLHLWCEMEGAQHPVIEADRGVYEVRATREWVQRVAPYANFIVAVLKTALPLVGPALNLHLGKDVLEQSGWKERLDLMKEGTDKLMTEITISDPQRLRQGVLTEDERSGLLALHAMLREVDPHHTRIGLTRVATYTGDYRWLCPTHYDQVRSNVPEQLG